MKKTIKFNKQGIRIIDLPFKSKGKKTDVPMEFIGGNVPEQIPVKIYKER